MRNLISKDHVKGQQNLKGKNTFLSTRAPFHYPSRSDIAFAYAVVKIKRVGQRARILPIHVKEGIKRGKSTRFFHFRKRQGY